MDGFRFHSSYALVKSLNPIHVKDRMNALVSNTTNLLRSALDFIKYKAYKVSNSTYHVTTVRDWAQLSTENTNSCTVKKPPIS